VVEDGDVWRDGEGEVSVVEDFDESELAGRPELGGGEYIFEEVEALKREEALDGKEEG
jgi:hypothetical protein